MLSWGKNVEDFRDQVPFVFGVHKVVGLVAIWMIEMVRSVGFMKDEMDC